MAKKPNVIFIYADDLGRGMLSCYGQKHFQTRNIDAVNAGGMNFINAHGCHFCAPARASLLSGIHDSHCGGWFFTKAGIYIDYAEGKLDLEEAYELIHNSGIEKRCENEFLPMVFNQAGYVTGQIGKLEWGFATTGDEIAAHGWQYHYGYYDHKMCHGYFPPFLFENGKRVDIPGNTHSDCGKFSFPGEESGVTPENLKELGLAQYNQDLFDEKIVEFLRANRDNPFFLYHPATLPHAVLSVTEIDPQVKDNPELTYKEKLYASMVLRLDKTVGLIERELEALGIADNTMIIFAADNGHSFYYGEQRMSGEYPDTLDKRQVNHLDVRYSSAAVGDTFDGNNGMSGCKTTNLEGGTRIPLMIKWPGVTIPGETKTLVANYDFYATMADLLDYPMAPTKDGVSYLPILEGRPEDMEEHECVVFAGNNGPAIIGKDGFKLRTHMTDKYNIGGIVGHSWADLEEQVIFELYDLPNDYTEANNLIEKYPARARELTKMLMRECDGNLIHGTTRPHYMIYNYDYNKEI